MFKVNRTYITICLLLIGTTCSSVFAIDFSQAMAQSKEQSTSIWSIFWWKSQVNNLYKKALKLVKDREVNATSFSLDSLVAEYNATCNGIQNIDFINILYHTNGSFQTIFTQIFAKGTKPPTDSEINKSYQKFFVCEYPNALVVDNKIQANIDQITFINSKINQLYYTNYSNSFALDTLNQKNFWSDLLWNGTLDDSDFDILYDVNQVGKLLFDSFKETPQILFYRLPKAPQSSSQNNNDSSSSYQLWAGGSSFPGTPWWPSWSSSSWSNQIPTSSWSPDSSQSQISSSQNIIPVISDDQEVQTLIDSTKTTITPASAALVFWNQCLSWDVATPAVEEEVPLMTSEEYISGLIYFVNNASLDNVIVTHLLEQFKKDNPLPLWWSTSDSGYADSVANAYAEQLFGDAIPGTCSYQCKNLPLAEQAQCELKCSKSCIQTCDGLWIQEKALCISDCICFVVAWPSGAGWEKVEDMFRIKFCKVPVQQASLNPWKKVFSIQAIFQEIFDVLGWLRDSGQTSKFVEKKEFLDSNTKISFADNFAFKLQVNFKPLFPKKSNTVETKEEEQDMKDFNLSIMNMNISAPDADNYNKYIVIADPVKNDANMEEATTIEDIQKNIDKFSDAVAAANTNQISGNALNVVMDQYVQKPGNDFVINMIAFLKDNQSFWNNTIGALFEMNKMSLELKAKIENSK